MEEGHTMDHEDLETGLGINFDDVAEEEILPPEKWQILNKVDSHGGTPLMKAVRSCDVNTVEGLLRCGVDVNARDEAGRRAIDYALDGSSEAVAQVALLLLKRDSLLPAIAKDAQSRSKFDRLVHQNEGIAKVFAEREAFHAMVKGNDVDSIQKLFKECNMKSSGVKYWVNREGQSALHAAGLGKSFDAWALLKSKHFVYDGEEEEEELETNFLKNETYFKKAMENYFAPIPDYHVLKMVALSKVFGSALGRRQTIHQIYEEIDKGSRSSLLLQCVQLDPRFEVVFDFKSSDARCARVKWDKEGLYGPLDRVYVGANLTGEFSHCEMVSDLIHELAHKAMLLVFENRGLPYREGDEKKEAEYGKVVSRVMSRGWFEESDNIISRIKRYPRELHPYELIARVPEIVFKFQGKAGEDGDGVEHLKTQAKELLDYYDNYVTPEMQNYIELSKATKMIPKSDFIDSFISDHKNDCFKVKCSNEPKIFKYKSLNVIPVSNLKLGISHLENCYKNILCLDSRMQMKYEVELNNELGRMEGNHAAIVWDYKMGAEFQEFCKRNAENVERNSSVTSLVPKTFDLGEGITPVDYNWDDLSDRTQEWVLGKKVTFQGREVTFEEMIEGVLCGME